MWTCYLGLVLLSVAQLCLALCNPMDCSPPDSSVHGILQARILEWVAIPFSRGSSWPRNRTWVSTIWNTREALHNIIAQKGAKHEWMHEAEYISGKESDCQAGDVGSVPRLGESPGEGNHNSLQYPCLGNLMDRGICWATVHRVAKEFDMTYWLNNSLFLGLTLWCKTIKWEDKLRNQ